MNNEEKIMQALTEALEIPPSAYEKANARYQDLGNWIGDPKSKCSVHSPHVYVQGSFRLGTVNRPYLQDETYDLDLGCRLRQGIRKGTHTQQFLKELVGGDLEAYRQARRIEAELDEKHRCWRLEYADELSFHMDVVPSIPEDSAGVVRIQEAMMNRGTDQFLAQRVAEHTGAITDTGHPQYRQIANNWRVSNSIGYAIWFESRIKLGEQFLRNRAFEAKAAKIDDLPAWKWRSPLQQSVQLLKRHRDVMFKDQPDSKPISIILTTLAAYAYQGEQTLSETLRRILADMEQYVLPRQPRVPNPVNPAEDFADKWYHPNYGHLRLEHSFRLWLKQAQVDFQLLADLRDPEQIAKQAKIKLGLVLDLDVIRNRVGGAPAIITTPRTHVIADTPPRPWRQA
jgi:hypothetical protein